MVQERSIINNRYTLDTNDRRKGSYAEVFRAYDLNFREDCAFKRPLLPVSELSEAERRQELEDYSNEARAVWSCRHPNVIAISNFDYDVKTGDPFLAMEWCEYSLGDVLEKNPEPMPWSDAFKYIKEVCKGLHYAHNLNVEGGPTQIIHRDIIPKNIMVRDDIPIIADFGLALRKNRLPGNPLMGTSGYMAPEQFERHPANHLTDIYALGITLFELIENRLPFKGPSEEEFKAQHRQQQLFWVIPEVPDGVQRIAEKAAAKEPSERFQSAEEMAEEMESMLARHGFVEDKDDEAAKAEKRYNELTIGQPDVELGDAPGIPDLLVENAKLMLEKGEIVQARERLTQSIKLRPSDPVLYHLRGKACISMFPDRALEDLSNAIDLCESGRADPASHVTDALRAELYDCRGSVYYERDLFEESGTDFGTAIDIDGGVIDYRVHYGSTKLANREYAAAITLLEPVLELDPESYDARFGLYQAYIYYGQDGLAAVQLDWLIADPRTEAMDHGLRLKLYADRAKCNIRLSNSNDTNGTAKLISAVADVKSAEAIKAENDTAPVVHRESLTLNISTDYQIMERLGADGLSQVFHARHMLEKDDVAVKVPAPWVEKDLELVKDFALGELLAKACDHPYVVETTKVVLRAGLCFSVMELLGQDLHSFIAEREKVLLTDALRYSSQICDALDRVHRFGIVHNDVKPSNMLLSVDERVVKLGEFLVAMPISDDNALVISDEIEPTLSWQYKGLVEQSPSTKDLRVGTEMYMAPEIIARQPRSARSDIYSLGVSLCEMLSPSTARTIFKAGNDTRMVSPDYSQTEGVARILNEELSSAGIPEAVIEVIKRATAADPEARFEDALAMKEAISGLQERLKDEI